jgi:hypothetical protein
MALASTSGCACSAAPARPRRGRRVPLALQPILARLMTPVSDAEGTNHHGGYHALFPLTAMPPVLSFQALLSAARRRTAACSGGTAAGSSPSTAEPHVTARRSSSPAAVHAATAAAAAVTLTARATEHPTMAEGVAADLIVCSPSLGPQPSVSWSPYPLAEAHVPSSNGNHSGHTAAPSHTVAVAQHLQHAAARLTHASGRPKAAQVSGGSLQAAPKRDAGRGPSPSNPVLGVPAKRGSRPAAPEGRSQGGDAGTPRCGLRGATLTVAITSCRDWLVGEASRTGPRYRSLQCPAPCETTRVPPPELSAATHYPSRARLGARRAAGAGGTARRRGGGARERHALRRGPGAAGALVARQRAPRQRPQRRLRRGPSWPGPCAGHASPLPASLP